MDIICTVLTKAEALEGECVYVNDIIVRVNIDDRCNNLNIEIIAAYNPDVNNARDLLDDMEVLLGTSTHKFKIAHIGFSFANHNLLVFDVDRGDLFTDQSKMKTKHISMTKINYNKLNLLLENKPFVIDGDNVDDQCDKCIKYLKDNINKVRYVQLHKTENGNAKYPWMNEDLKYLIKC
ncbi:hypothetical protein PR048_032013 [Dryococelus australis]|uniref:Uncharacterized protein n=1 Tax=Dryococelus australis TaxID=614101 RepID=A0ABQ9G6X3_9NEOP|nr:hypothetical protein PR048_032013 [Dryococelus australis]